MKTLMTLLSVSAMVLASGGAFADNQERNTINHQNLAKRPYQQVPVEAQSKKDHFEGATLIDEAAESDKKHQPIRLHMLGKRPYMEKNTD